MNLISIRIEQELIKHPIRRNIIDLVNTTSFHPCQWEFKTNLDEQVYVRYKSGSLSVSINSEEFAEFLDILPCGIMEVDWKSIYPYLHFLGFNDL